MCLDSLMDRTVDSGSTSTGSIPVRDAKIINESIYVGFKNEIRVGDALL